MTFPNPRRWTASASWKTFRRESPTGSISGYVGDTVEVLVEEEQRPGHWKGRTRTNKLTFFDAPGQLRGSLARLRITWAGPWTLRGELV